MTNSSKVRKARKVIIELMLATSPNSRTLQCLASEYGVTEIRFKAEDRGCLLCGLCVRMCDEQMQAGAIGFAHRGVEREVSMPFHKRSGRVPGVRRLPLHLSGLRAALPGPHAAGRAVQRLSGRGAAGSRSPVETNS